MNSVILHTRGEPMDQVTNYLLEHWVIWTIISAFFSGFFGVTLGALLSSYFTEKGKGLATKKDIDDVLIELRRVTTETESIKAQIGGDVCQANCVGAKAGGV